MRPARLIPRPSHRPAVVLVAHGSRDPRAAVATESLARAVRKTRPEWLVRASYLDHEGPRPLDVLASVPASRAILVPLLLTKAYHGRVDLPAVVREASSLPLAVTATEVLGPASPLLLAALHRRLAEAAAAVPLDAPDLRAVAVPPPDLGAGADSLRDLGAGAEPLRDLGAAGEGARLDGVVLASAGTRNPAARETVAEAAAALGRRLGVPAEVAYASGPGTRSDEAVARLRAAGAERVGMAAYFLAPGLLYDLAADAARGAGAVVVAEPLADAPELVRLVDARVRSVLPGMLPAAA